MAATAYPTANRNLWNLVAGFVAGFLGVLIFHQLMLGLLHLIGLTAGQPYSMRLIPPLGIPAFLSAAFWGGVWGIVLAFLLRALRPPDLLFGTVFGALVLTLVAFTLVATLKGQPPFAGGNKQVWWRALLYHAAWGWGAALLLRPFRRAA